jgi:hypothetical protein
MSENSTEQTLNEFKISTLGKVFFATLGLAALGKMVRTRIRGTQEQVDAIAGALVSSRKFQEELNKPGATVDSVVQKLGVKNMSTSQFERVFGVPWPL